MCDTILAQTPTSITRLRVHDDGTAVLQTLTVTQAVALAAEALEALQALPLFAVSAATAVVHWAHLPAQGAACGTRTWNARLSAVPHLVTCPACLTCWEQACCPPAAPQRGVSDGSF